MAVVIKHALGGFLALQILQHRNRAIICLTLCRESILSGQAFFMAAMAKVKTKSVCACLYLSSSIFSGVDVAGPRVARWILVRLKIVFIFTNISHLQDCELRVRIKGKYPPQQVSDNSRCQRLLFCTSSKKPRRRMTVALVIGAGYAVPEVPSCSSFIPPKFFMESTLPTHLSQYLASI